MLLFKPIDREPCRDGAYELYDQSQKRLYVILNVILGILLVLASRNFPNEAVPAHVSHQQGKPIP